jgi:DNA-binding Lrp family transcriptional regulator
LAAALRTTSKFIHRRLDELMGEGLVLRFACPKSILYELSSRGRRELGQGDHQPPHLETSVSGPQQPKKTKTRGLSELPRVEELMSLEGDSMTVYDRIEELEERLFVVARTGPKEILDFFGLPVTDRNMDDARGALEGLGWQKPSPPGSKFWTRKLQRKNLKSPPRSPGQAKTDDALLMNAMQTGLWTRQQVQERLGLTAAQARWSLHRLEAAGLVRAIGRGTGTMYFSTKQKGTRS